MTKLVYIGGYGHSGSTLWNICWRRAPKRSPAAKWQACFATATVRANAPAGGGSRSARCGVRCFASPETLDGMSHERFVARPRRARPRRACHPGRLRPRPPGARPPSRFALRARLGQTSGSCISCATRARSPGPAVKKAGRRGTRPLLPLRSASAALGWWIANLACELFGAQSSRPLCAPPLRGSRARAWRGDAGSVRQLVPGRSGARGDRRDATTAISSMATACAGEPVTRRGQGGCGWRRDMPRLPRARLAPHRAAPLALRLRLSRGNARADARCRWRNRDEEVDHASQISSATKGRRCRALRQARQDEPEQAQRRIESMYKSMSEKQLDEFASTKRKGKPEHVAKSRTKRRRSTRKSPRAKSRRATSSEVAIAAAPARCRPRRRRR